MRAQIHPATVEIDSVIEIDAAQVRPFEGQPRTYFGTNAQEALVRSISTDGQIQPGLVRAIERSPEGHEFELVDGERRWRACLELGKRFRAIVINPGEIERQFALSVISNCREGHTPMETARAIHRLVNLAGMSHGRVGDIFGKSSTWSKHNIRLVDLIPELQQIVEDTAKHRTGRDLRSDEDYLPTSVAVELAGLPKDEQFAAYRAIREQKMGAGPALQWLGRRGARAETKKRWHEPGKLYDQLSTFADGLYEKTEVLRSRVLKVGSGELLKSRGRVQIETLADMLDDASEEIVKLRAAITGEDAAEHEESTRPSPSPEAL